VAGFQCKRWFDGQLFREFLAMKELTISSLHKFECVQILLFARLDLCRWSCRRSVKSKSTLMGKVQGTGSFADVK